MQGKLARPPAIALGAVRVDVAKEPFLGNGTSESHNDLVFEADEVTSIVASQSSPSHGSPAPRRGRATRRAPRSPRGRSAGSAPSGRLRGPPRGTPWPARSLTGFREEVQDQPPSLACVVVDGIARQVAVLRVFHGRAKSQYKQVPSWRGASWRRTATFGRDRGSTRVGGRHRDASPGTPAL